ncbi:type I methionyl aminopeptidase [Feifania hominis]|uniref:Methionine aminopeptidase n=1 Tax=Feifania hominis TaxID=2763660 RepID=A0A926DG15_9FIRM|nr:type I methionyl aminopeptidase [Feifania hominis]MBC8537114.1 type I methionyl aminopeptidase [Feifania hominis]
MILLKSNEEIEAMRRAGHIAAGALKLAGEAIAPGVTTWEIDRLVHDFIVKSGAVPSFLHYGGFPASACISVDSEVIHGIPSKSRVLAEGSIVSVDVGALIGGYHGDCANTFPVGRISDDAQRLIDATRQSFFEAMKVARPGGRIGDIGHAVQSYVEPLGYGVVTEYVGHGVGQALHEDPEVPNYGRPGHGIRLQRDMTIAVEPMINAGTPNVRRLRDGWTVVTADGALSAHYENTIAITDGEPILLTVA